VRTLTLKSAAGQPLRSVAWSPDGKWLAAGGDRRSICVWETSDWTLLRRLDDLRGKVKCVCWSRAGELAGLESDGTLRVWNIPSGKQLWLHRGPAEGQSCAFSPDGRVLAAGYKSGILELLHARTGESRHTRLGHQTGVRSLAFTPDGKTLASGAEDGTLRLWHVASCHELIAWQDQSAAINALSFSPDGHRLAAALHDGGIMLLKGSQ
jgi:WD40 repeat protein